MDVLGQLGLPHAVGWRGKSDRGFTHLVSDAICAGCRTPGGERGCSRHRKLISRPAGETVLDWLLWSFGKDIVLRFFAQNVGVVGEPQPIHSPFQFPGGLSHVIMSAFLKLRNGRRKLKTVLHVIDSTEPGGAETVFLELADRLRFRGYRSVVVVAGPGWVLGEATRRGLEPIELHAKGSFNLGYLAHLVRLIRIEKIQLIQSHLLGSNVYCALAGRLTKTPVVATYHGMVDISPNERFRRLKKWAMQQGITYYVTVSQALANVVQTEKLLDPSKTAVIYNGIDASLFRNSSKSRVRERLGLPLNATVALAIGNLHHAKGFDVLIRAAAMLMTDHAKLHFVIAGETKEPLLSSLVNLADSLGVRGRIHFLGFVDGTAELLADSDIYVLSSISEGFSLSVLEALASGVPVVSTRCGGPEEIIVNLETGLLVPANDAASLAGAVDHLLSDAKLAKRLRDAGNRLVENSFDINRMVDQYELIYGRCLASRK